MEKKGGEVLITPHQLLLFAPSNQHWKFSIEKIHNKFQKLDCKKQGRLLITPHMLLFFAPNNQIHNWKICTKQLTLSIEHFGWEICRILCRRKAGCKGIWFNQTLGSGGNFPRDLLQLPNSKLPPLFLNLNVAICNFWQKWNGSCLNMRMWLLSITTWGGGSIGKVDLNCLWEIWLCM